MTTTTKEYTIVQVVYLDADGFECIENVPVFGAIENSSRLEYLLSIGGEIIPN